MIVSKSKVETLLRDGTALANETKVELADLDFKLDELLSDIFSSRREREIALQYKTQENPPKLRIFVPKE